MRRFVELFAICLPQISYDDCLGYATLLTNVQIWISAYGALGWYGGQWCVVSLCFGLTLLIALEMKSSRLMQYCCVSIFPLMIADIIWFAAYAKHANSTKTKWTLACVIFIFFMRIPLLSLLAKMWSLDWGGEAGNDYGNNTNANAGTIAPGGNYSAPGVGTRLDDVEAMAPPPTAIAPPAAPPTQSTSNQPQAYVPPNDFS